MTNIFRDLEVLQRKMGGVDREGGRRRGEGRKGG